MAKQIAFDIIARDKASKTFGKIGNAAKLLGVVGLGGVVANAVQTEAAFDKTMNVMQATSGASGKEMDKLRALAVKMGADTKFSAGAAADAMLELARGGIKPAQIQAGALQGTLTLAAAGELEMGEAANIAVKAMGQFGLKGKDMGKIAAALAGGANASSASVRDMSIALAQGGLAANSVGFSVQETTAILAAFSNAGLEGSDAGTSMKTMLDRLQPATEGAKAAMIKLGAYSLKTGNAFVKSNGEFKSAAQIAEILHKGTEKLTEAERKRLITKAFGSDAQRAATIMAKEGAKGIRKLTKATSDQSAAEKQAAANMKGTGGALERMQGSLETASLAIGQMMAPAVVFLADKVGAAANEFVEFTPKIKAAGEFVKDNKTAFMTLAAAIAAVVAITKIHSAVMVVQAAGGLVPLLKATKLITTATKVYAAMQWILNAALTANPIGLIIVGIAALIAIIVLVVKKTDFFSKLWSKAWGGIKTAFWAVFGFIKNNWMTILAVLTGPIGIAVLAVVKNWDKIKAGASKMFEGVKAVFGKVVSTVAGIPGRITGAIGDLGALLLGAGKAIIQGLIDGIMDKVKDLKGALGKVTKLIPDWKGPLDKDKVLLRPAGLAIMDGLIDGIESRKMKLTGVLAKVTAFIAAQNDKVKSLIGKRSEMANSFQGFTSSVFSASLGDSETGAPPSVSALLDFQAQERARAAQLKADMQKLTKAGLSKSLIQQLASSGASGIAQIRALASGSTADVKRLNSLNAATQSDLRAAGMTAGNAMYGDDIRGAQRDKRLAQEIASQLRAMLRDEKDKDKVYVVIDGKVIHEVLLKRKRTTGGSLGLA